jgi:Ni/Fe-hydrogenase subunit HybB-like protein
MSATTATRSKLSFPLSFYVLGVVALFGLALGVYRMATSLGAATNLSNAYPWGLWIAFDFSVVPLSAGAFTLAATLHIFNRKEYHGIAHLALLAGFLGYTMVILVLVLDINRWDQFYNVLLPGLWNLHSFMFEVAMSITLYFGVMILELFPIVFGRKNWPAARLVEQFVPLIAGVGVLLSTVHQSSIGAIFLTLRHRLDPLWWSPIIPLLSFISALFSGLSVATLLAILTWRALRRPAPMPLLQGLTRVAAYLLAAFLALKFGDLLLAGELGLMFTSGAFSLVFWVEVILLAAAMIIYFRAGKNENALLAGTICTLSWLALNRFTIAWFALRAPAGATYFPSWIEIGIVVAAFAAGILFYALGVRHVPDLRAGVVEAHKH